MLTNLCVVLLLITSTYTKLVAQQMNPSSSRSKKLFESAAQYLTNRDFESAIKALKEVTFVDSLFVTARQQLADVYLRQKNFKEAARHYELVSKLAPDLTNITWFGLGESLLNLGAYTSSKIALETYLNKAGRSSDKRAIAEKYIQDCIFSIEALKRTDNTPIMNMGEKINSVSDEYFPMLTADRTSIIFTRQAAGKLEYIFTSQHKEGNWSIAEPIIGKVNTDQYSEGAHCISPDGKYLFFTGCNRPEGKGSCDIYVSHLEDGKWGVPHNLGKPINTGAWEAQPAISPDGNTLYFVSNRKGGYGGNDIWCSTLTEDGGWSEPKNMGSAINTPYDESTPFVHADNETIYFASNGWPGFGNKDLFISMVDSAGNRKSPINLGAPINDHLEQRALTVSMDGSTAYFAADRADGFGGLDIYTCILHPSVRPKPVGFVKGKVYDKDTGEVIKATINLTRLSNQQLIFRSEADYIDGSFLIPLPLGHPYALHVQHPSYLFYSQHFTLEDSHSLQEIYPIDVALEGINTGNSVTLNNIFFPVNESRLLPASETDLEELVHFMQYNKQVKIEISGHTDNSGKEQDNQLLSEKRALAVYTYLLTKGIDKDRMEYKGYGQNNPIADNSTEQGKQQNRRTDFKIIATNYAK